MGDEKLRAAANLLANSWLKVDDPAKSSFEEVDHLLHCLDGLSVGAIVVLGAARNVSNQMTSGNRTFQFSQLLNQLPGRDADLVMSLASELAAMNLLNVRQGLIEAPDYRIYTIRVTPIGVRLAERFIEGKM